MRLRPLLIVGHRGDRLPGLVHATAVPRADAPGDGVDRPERRHPARPRRRREGGGRDREQGHRRRALHPGQEVEQPRPSSTGSGSSPTTRPPGTSTRASCPSSAAAPARFGPWRRCPGTNTVLVGGTFQTVNGGPLVGGIVKLDAGNGQAVSQFQGLTDGWVFDMALVGNKLYLGGTFTKLKNVARVRLGALDATTGALDPSLDIPVTDALENAPYVWDLDVNPSGTRLVAVGNFATVGGQTRRQVAVIDLSTNPATLSTWQTNRYGDVCFHDWYVRDVDISPDGTYFVVVTTGAWRGTTTLCDTAARWEIASTGAGQEPTWVDYTGGDTLTAVTITGPVVYIAGHQRWQNNASGARRRHRRPRRRAPHRHRRPRRRQRHRPHLERQPRARDPRLDADPDRAPASTSGATASTSVASSILAWPSCPPVAASRCPRRWWPSCRPTCSTPPAPTAS